ncbi:hypothetical protein ASD11_11150 [Aeromicrobium sp. Root495]|uniref:5-oxoprolinase subunit C family protein n=1 Tax=Aeromicrobium sp. Root495 TaxID=1736550 RepID=UPI0007009C1A|nr:biotin-dependent carboxyltransferase family protein [Aeromicrobium sp. Root495]KQY60047.1 hypothetical protein ASD11_11150 [Aeromicrobium sp. Root495]
MSLVVEAPGALTLVQDAGRPGLGSQGVGSSGAFDRMALRTNHALLGNHPDAAVLECLGGGLVLRATQEHRVAVTGAVGPLRVDGVPVGHGRSLRLGPGSVLDVAPTVLGLRTYVGVAGGLDVPPVLGSRSTDVLSRLGPGAVEAGQRLAVGVGHGPSSLREAQPLLAAGDLTVAIMMGPRDDWFTAAGVRHLLTAAWRVSERSDRVGVRLEGHAVERARTGELASEPCVRGSVQVTSAGLPVVLGPDHPVTGGYPVIGVVVPRDVDALAQVRSGQVVRFRRAHPRRT